MTNSRNTLRIGLIALTTRIVLLISPLVFKMLIFNENIYANFADFLNQNLVRWDAHHFLYLSQNWYTSQGDEANYIVFQPLYPFLIKITNIIIGNYLISSLIISNTAFILGAIIFYKLLRIDFSEKISKRAILLLSIFPTSYFFSLPYTESLFFLLIVSAFYLARKRSWFGAGIITALAGITRYFGIILIPTLLFELFKEKKKDRLKPILAIILPSIFSLGLYLYINKYLFNSSLAFIQILKEHWYKTTSLPWKGIVQAIHIAGSGWNPFSVMIGLMEAISIICAWVFIPLSFKKIRSSWLIYYTLGVLLSSSTSFLLSTPRYLLSLPPFFLILSLLIKKEWCLNIISFIFINLLSYFSLLYVSGHWAF